MSHVAVLAICIANSQNRQLPRADSIRAEPILLEVRIGDVASSTLQAMRVGDAAIFPLAELLTLAGFPVSAESARYVSEDALAAILHATVSVDWDDLTATIGDDGTLPVSRALARQNRRALFQRASERATAATGISAISARIPTFPRDVTLDYDVASTRDRVRRTTSIHAVMGGSLVGGSVYLGVLKAPGVAQGLLAWERDFPDRSLMRSLRLGGVLLGAAGLGTGITVSSQIPNQIRAVAPIVFRESPGPGWQMEVYRDDDLAYAGVTDSTGGYVARVPVSRGVNRFTVSAYGPRGEQRTIERYVYVGSDALRPRSGSYDMAIGKCAIAECDYAAQFDARYSPFAGITLGGDFGDEVSTNGHQLRLASLLSIQARDDIDVTLRSTTNQLGVQAHYAPNPALDLATSYGRTSVVRGRHGVTAPRPVAIVNASWRPQTNGFMSVSGEFTGRDITGKQRLRIASSASMMGHYVHPSMTLTRGLDDGMVAIGFGAYSESAMPAVFPAGSRLRIGIADQPYADSFAEFVLAVRAAAQLHIGANWTRGQSRPRLALSLGMITRASRFDIRSDASQVGPAVTNSVSGSARIGLNRSPGSRLVTVSPFQQLGRAQIAGSVFMDSNRNGIRDPGEGGIPGVSVVIGDMSVETDSGGVYRFLDVGPFVPVVITVDSLTLPGEAMVAPSVRLIPPANATTRVDIPVTDAFLASRPANVTQGVPGVAQDAQRGDSASVHRDNFEPRTGDSNPVTNPRQSAESGEHIPTKRGPVSIRDVQIVITPRVDERQRAGQFEHAIDLQRRASSQVVFVRDVPHYLFDEILDRNDTGRAAVLVDHYRHVRARPAQIVKNTFRRSAVRNVQRLAHELAELERGSRLSQPQVLREKYADDVVQRFAVERIARVPLRPENLKNFVLSRINVDRHHLSPRPHHVVRLFLLEIKDPRKHRSLRLVELAVGMRVHHERS